MTIVLLTGFEPFAGDSTNPSGEAVRIVASRWEGPEVLVTDVLPVTFAGAAERILDLMAEHAPDIVLCTGLAGGRTEISVERVAVNLLDARIPDNDGAQPIDAPSVAGAPVAHFATVPARRSPGVSSTTGLPPECPTRRARSCATTCSSRRAMPPRPELASDCCTSRGQPATQVRRMHRPFLSATLWARSRRRCARASR